MTTSIKVSRRGSFFNTCMAVAIMMLLAMTSPTESRACTRIIYHGADSLFIIGRSLDWKTPIPTNVYVYPAGMVKQGSDKSNPVRWTSRYGAVYAVGYDAGVTEGMNEKGLSVNGLFCKGAQYSNKSNDMYPTMSLAMFPAWILDLCATTDDAVRMLKYTPFTLYGSTFDDGTTTALHWGITDASGKSVVVEFVDGNMNIYDVTDQRAMTNDPNWPSMTAIINYWDKIGGKNALPGTVSSPDRCVRGNYFAHHVDAVSDPDLGASICRTVLNNCCVPYSYTLNDPSEPNVSSTQWRSFSNLRDKRYYFDMATGNGFYYIDLKKCDLRPGASVMKITTSEMLNALGDQTKALKKVKPFTVMY